MRNFIQSLKKVDVKFLLSFIAGIVIYIIFNRIFELLKN
jgi:hypothetical protein